MNFVFILFSKEIRLSAALAVELHGSNDFNSAKIFRQPRTVDEK